LPEQIKACHGDGKDHPRAKGNNRMTAIVITFVKRIDALGLEPSQAVRGRG